MVASAACFARGYLGFGGFIGLFFMILDRPEKRPPPYAALHPSLSGSAKDASIAIVFVRRQGYSDKFVGKLHGIFI